MRPTPRRASALWDDASVSTTAEPAATPVEVAVVGTVNLDQTVRVRRLPEPGESVAGEIVATGPGGKGANQAVAAARMGAATALVACVGDDTAGATVLEVLAREPGLDVRGVTRAAAPTGAAFVTIDEAGGNTVVSARGANAHLDDARVHRNGGVVAAAGVLLVQLGVAWSAVEAALDIARGVGTLVVLDPVPADEVTDELLRRVDVCTPNESEAARLTGGPVDDPAGMTRAADVLLRRGCGAVVLTLGARGAYVATRPGAGRRVAPPPVAVVDPTAAGDAFAGALAAALARGAHLDDAVDDAVIAGALATTRLGAVVSLPTRAEVDRSRAGLPAR